MNEQKAKTVQESMARQVHIITPVDVNATFALFGGRLMEWIDIVAGVVSRRHAGMETRTAAVEHLEFLKPAYLDDIVELVGRVTFVGRTSMEVCVDSYVERMGSSEGPQHVNRALLTMVAVDADGHPAPVPSLCISTPEEQADWDAAAARRDARKNVR